MAERKAKKKPAKAKANAKPVKKPAKGKREGDGGEQQGGGTPPKTGWGARGAATRKPGAKKS